MRNLGEAFIDGRIVYLDKTSNEDLEKYLNQIKEKKEEERNNMNKILEKIYM